MPKSVGGVGRKPHNQSRLQQTVILQRILAYPPRPLPTVFPESCPVSIGICVRFHRNPHSECPEPV